MNTRPKPERDQQTGRFLAGNSGNGGRQKGARSKLGEQFLSDLQQQWEEHGKAVLIKAREEKPMEFVRMVAGLLPKELLVHKDPTDEMTDEQLGNIIDAFNAALERSRDGSVNIEVGADTDPKDRLQ